MLIILNGVPADQFNVMLLTKRKYQLRVALVDHSTNYFSELLTFMGVSINFLALHNL
jgi:hypothetical protein